MITLKRARSGAATDAGLVAVAGICALAARLAVPVPWAAATVLVSVAAVVGVTRGHPVLIGAAVVVLVGSRAGSQIAALDTPVPQQVDGVAALVSDPERSRFGWQTTLSVGGRRYLASTDDAAGASLRDLAVGDHVVVGGTTRPIRGAPAGWVRSNHLAGRLVVRRLERGPPAAPWFRAANNVRGLLKEGSGSFDPELRPLYLGMVMGDDRDLSELREFRFRAAGLTHLSAVSGQNVAFVLMLFAPVFSRSSGRARWIITLVALIAFVLVTRAEPSVLRAAVMAAVVAGASIRGRAISGVGALALAVVLLLSVDPLLVHSLGFGLSVAATLALVTVAPILAEHLVGPPSIRAAVAATLSAQVATAPMLAGVGSTFTLAAVPANLLAVPVAGIVMILGMTVGLISGLVAEPVASLLLIPSRLAVSWIDLVARTAASAPIPAMDTRRLGAVVILVVVVLVFRGKAVWLSRSAAGAALAVLSAACMPVRSPVGLMNPAEGVQAAIGACGGVVVQVSGNAGEDDALVALTRLGVRRIDVLVVGAGAGSQAAMLGEQWRVRRRVFLGDTEPEGWVVGGASASTDGAEAVIGVSEVPCRLGR